MDIALSRKYIESLCLIEGGWPSKKRALFDAYKVLLMLPGYDAKTRELSGGYVLYETPGGYSLLAYSHPEKRIILDIIKDEDLPDIEAYKDAAMAANGAIRDLIADFLPKRRDKLLSDLITSSFSPSFCMLLDQLEQETRDKIRGIAFKPFFEDRTIEKAKDENKHIVSQVFARLGIQQKEDALARALAKLEEDEEVEIDIDVEETAPAELEPEAKAEPETEAPAPVEETKPEPEIEAKPREKEPYVRLVQSKTKEFEPVFEIPVKQKTEEKKPVSKPEPSPAPTEPQKRRKVRTIRVDPADLERAILASLAENYRQLIEKRKETAKTNKPLKHVTLAAREDVIANNDIDEILKILDRRIRKNGLKSSGERWLILLATTVDERTADIIDRHYPGKVYYTDEPEKGKPDFAFIVKPNKNPEAEKEEEISLVKDKRASFDAPVEKNAYDQDFVDEFGYYPFDEEEEIQEEEDFESNPNLPYEEEEPAYPKIWRCYLCGNKKTHTGTPAKVIKLSNGKTAYVCQKHKNKI